MTRHDPTIGTPALLRQTNGASALLPRDLRWLNHLRRHGPLPSTHLLDLTSDTHRCRDTGLRRLRHLRDQGWLRLPPQQRQTARAEFNPYVYDLTPKAIAELDHRAIEPGAVRPCGHWWHAFAVAQTTSRIEIDGRAKCIDYIPAATILAIKGASFALPLAGNRRLIPDQLFALKYPDGFLTYALEVDRGTEPVSSRKARKSLASSVAAFAEAFEKREFQIHYGLKSDVVCLWVVQDAGRKEQLEKLVSRHPKEFRSRVSISVGRPDPALLRTQV